MNWFFCLEQSNLSLLKENQRMCFFCRVLHWLTCLCSEGKILIFSISYYEVHELDHFIALKIYCSSEIKLDESLCSICILLETYMFQNFFWMLWQLILMTPLNSFKAFFKKLNSIKFPISKPSQTCWLAWESYL